MNFLHTAGTYYISVVPTGVAAVSSYGSLGDYLLTVTFPSELASHHSSSATATQGTVPGLNAFGTAAKGKGCTAQPQKQQYVGSIACLACSVTSKEPWRHWTHLFVCTTNAITLFIQHQTC